MLTQEQLNRTICRISISCAAASPVRHSVLQEKDAALKMGEVLCFLNWCVSPQPKDLRICYLKMYPVSCRMIRGKPSPASSTRFANWGMAWNGWCLTRRITESPSPGGECSLSAFLIKDAPVLPYREANPASLVRMAGRKQGYTLYDSEGLACTQTSNTGGFGGKTGLYFINSYKSDLSIPEKARHNTAGQGHSPIDRKGACLEAGVLRIKEATKKGYEKAGEGDTVNFSYAGSNTRRGRVGRDMAHTLNTSSSQGVVRQGRIRRLTPRECFRLQGFGEEQIDRILAITSDTQAYKQAGNAVTVNVIEAIGKRLRAVDEGLKAGSV